MSRVMRKKARVSYYEPEEPSFDEYVFCTSCGDYVYEYCSIHGPLLVIPDDEVPSPTGLPSFVPRAALTIPHTFLHLAPSTIPDAGIGVFSTLTLPRGVRFGPYRGLKTDEANSSYCWQIFDSDHKPSHVLDARDPNRSNWMRYVNCSRNYSEQNLVAFQYQSQLYYRTTRIIPRFTELLVFYGSEFASELNIDLRRYHSPVYSETLVKYADESDETPLNDSIQPNDCSTNNINVFQNSKTEEFTPESNIESQYYTSESNSMIIDLNSEQDKTEDNIRRYSEAIKYNFEKENVDSNITQDSHSQSIGEKSENVHLESHNKEFIHKNVCSVCNVKFSTKSDYINHEVRIHKSNIQYKACTVCDYKTVESKSLNEHVMRHSGTKKKCKLCNFEFVKNSTLKKHVVRIHNKNNSVENIPTEPQIEKPYACKICGNKYTSNKNLQRHMYIHSQDKTHICMLCDKKFYVNYKLKKHMNIHSIKSPHMCVICNKGYTEKRNLRRHMAEHGILTQKSMNNDGGC